MEQKKDQLTQVPAQEPVAIDSPENVRMELYALPGSLDQRVTKNAASVLLDIYVVNCVIVGRMRLVKLCLVYVRPPPPTL